MIRKPLIAGILALAAVAASAPITRAQTTYTWNGGANPDGNWSNPANWGGTVPVDSDINTLIALAGTTNLNTVLDFLNGSGGGSFNINSLSFTSNAGSFTINPTASNVTTLRIGAGGMLISNANHQTIAAPVALSAAQTWNLAGTTPFVWTNPQSAGNPPVFQQITSFRPSRLTVSGNVDLGGNTLTVNVNTPTNFPNPNPYVSFDAAYAGTTLQINNEAPGEARISGTVSNGGITKTGAGVLTLNGPSNPTGAVAVNGGALAINRSTVGAAPFGAGTVGLGGGALSFRRVASPLALNATGFNHDVISSVSDSLSANPFGTTIALDNTEASNDGWVLYEVGASVNPGFQPTGLPTGGFITGAQNTLATYQLRPYGANGAESNNALQLNSVDGFVGTLTLTTPGQFSTISILNTAGGGQGNYTARLNFQDGSFTDINVNSPDWFNQAPIVISGLGRFNRLDGRFENQVNNPRLYTTDIHLSDLDQLKNLTSVRFTRTSGGTLNFFGISGYATDVAAPTSYANAISVTSSSTIEMWGMRDLTLGPLSIGGNTLTTVAGGVTTLTFPGTSITTGSPTFNIATSQTFTPGPIDFNSTARTVTKSGNGTMLLDAPSVDATAINRLTVTAGTATVSNITSMGNTPNLTVSGGTANLGPYTTLNSVTTSGGTANLTNVSSVVTTLTASGGTTTFTPNVTIPTTTVTGGTVNFQAGAALTTATVNGGTVNFNNGGDGSAGRLNGAGIASTINLSSGSVLTVGAAGQPDSYVGFVNGAGSLVKQGAGTMTLTRGFSTYAGGTTVQDGQLTGSQPGTLGTGAVNLQGDAVLGIGGVPGATILGFGVNGTGWSLQGFQGTGANAATVATDVLTITTANNDVRKTAWFNTKQPIGSFTATFDYLRSAGSANPADGASFTIQNEAGNIVGNGGGSLGLTEISPSGSVLINIFQNPTRGIRVTTNGVAGNPYTPVEPVLLVDSGLNPVTFTIAYDHGAKTLNVSLNQGANSFTLPTVTGFDLAPLGADAWVGFTGATGGLNTVQQFTNFRFNLVGGPTPPPVSTYTNAVNIAADATVGIRPKVAADGVTSFTMGALNVGSGASLTVQPDAGSLADTAYSLTLGATTLNGPATFTVANNGTGAGSLALGAINDGGTARAITKSGLGTLVLGTAATSLVDGTVVNVSDGTLRVNHSNALGSLAAVSVGATLSLGASPTIGALNGGGAATLNGNTLTVGSTNNLPSAFSGVIADGTGAGGLTKAGTGTLTLSGVNTYSGTTNVNAGTLNGTGTIAGPVNLNDAASLQGGTGGSTTATNTLSLPGGLQLDGANNLLLVVGDTNVGNGLADPTSSRLDLGAGVLSRNTGGAADLTTIRLSAVPMTLDAFQQYTVTVASFGSTANLSLTDFTIDPNPTGFVFAEAPFVTLTGNSLMLTFTPTPEPGAVMSLAVLAGLATVVLRRRNGRPAADTPTGAAA